MDPVSLLMLEDSHLDAELVKARLAKATFPMTIERVEGREGFLEAIHNRNFDIVLADFALPDFDGMSALEIVRKKSPYLPFIFVSGVLGEEVAVEALRQGATDYVLKPRLERLLPSVERALTEERNRAERSRSEAELLRSQRFCQQILETTHDCVITLDTSGTLLSMNRGGRAVMGVQTEEDFHGLKWTSLWEESGSAQEALDEVLRTGAAKFEGARNLRGETRWYDVVLSAFIEFDVKADRILAIARDVTDRRALLASERRIRSDAEQKARELEKSLVDLESYALVASHDLQEPIRVVRTYAQLLSRRCGSLLDPACSQFLTVIEDNAGRMHLLVRDLLAYSRVVHEEESLELIETRGLIDEVLNIWSTAIAETGIEVRCDPLPPIRGNRRQILQVFHNLIENAVKYRSEGSPFIHIGGSNGSSSSTFFVQDNGVGFEQKYAEKIFQIFKRLHGKEFPGTGVGLAICKRVIERHGGRIWADSERGRGTTFYVMLPSAGKSHEEEVSGPPETAN